MSSDFSDSEDDSLFDLFDCVSILLSKRGNWNFFCLGRASNFSEMDFCYQKTLVVNSLLWEAEIWIPREALSLLGAFPDSIEKIAIKE